MITDAEWERARLANEAIRTEAEKGARRRRQSDAVESLVDLLGGWARERQERREHAGLEKALNDSNHDHQGD